MGALALSGCRSAEPRSPIEEAVALTGVSGAIVFRSDGGSIDATGGLPATLTAGDVVRRTLASDPGIQAALARVRAAEAQADQARLLPNPIVSVLLHIPQNGVAAPIEVAVAEDLFSIIQMPGRIDAADDRLRQATAEALTVVLDVLAEAQSRCVLLQSIEAQLATLEERRKLLANLLGVAGARLEKGEGTQLEVTTVEAEGAGLRSEIAELRLQRQDERLILERQMGEPSCRTEWRLAPWEPTEDIVPAERAWIAAALERRPEIQARRWELAALGDEAGLATLSLFSGAGLGANAQWDDRWTAGPTLSLPLPIFDFGQARRAVAEARVIEARHALVQAQRQAVEGVRRALAGFVGASAARDDVAQNLVALQVRRRREAEAAYLAGQTDVTALFLAERDVQTTTSRLISLRRRAAEARIGLERAVGGPGVASLVEKQVRSP